MAKFKETNIEVVTLTRKDIKMLNETGVSPMKNQNLTQDELEKFVDVILETFYKDNEEVETLSYYDAVTLATQTFQRSVSPTEDEIKN